MSNFTFLKTDEWQEIYITAQQAERYTRGDPRAALFYGRRAVELLANWLHDFHPIYTRPYDDNLNVLLRAASVVKNVPPAVQTKLHLIRKEGNLALRDLVQLIGRQESKSLITNFTDEVGMIQVAKVPYLTGGVNVVQYRKKVQQFLQSHKDHLVIHKLRRAQPLTSLDLSELERFFFEAADVGTREEFEAAYPDVPSLSAFIRGLVGLDRRAAKEHFARYLDDQTCSPDQIRFVDMIIDELTKRGSMDPNRLYERPFIDLHDMGLHGFFDDEQAGGIIRLIEEINESVHVKAA